MCNCADEGRRRKGDREKQENATRKGVGFQVAFTAQRPAAVPSWAVAKTRRPSPCAAPSSTGGAPMGCGSLRSQRQTRSGSAVHTRGTRAAPLPTRSTRPTPHTHPHHHRHRRPTSPNPPHEKRTTRERQFSDAQPERGSSATTVSPRHATVIEVKYNRAPQSTRNARPFPAAPSPPHMHTRRCTIFQRTTPHANLARAG
jgi:hypothetical protein